MHVLPRLNRSRWRCLGAPLALVACLLLAGPRSGFAQSQTSATATSRSGVSKAYVEPGTGGVTIVRPLSATMQADGFSQFLGISSLDTTARQMTLNRVVLPPRSRGRLHMHKNSETMLMVVQGTLTVLIGAKAEKMLLVNSGEFLYVPGNVWHQWTNPGGDYVTLVEARSDADPRSNMYFMPAP